MFSGTIINLWVNKKAVMATIKEADFLIDVINGTDDYGIESVLSELQEDR